MLVKWTVDRPLDRRFLPRLPAPICHLSVAPDNRYLAISTSDNGEFVCVTCFLTKLMCTVMHCITTFCSDCTYNGGKNFWKL